MYEFTMVEPILHQKKHVGLMSVGMSLYNLMFRLTNIVFKGNIF